MKIIKQIIIAIILLTFPVESFARFVEIDKYSPLYPGVIYRVKYKNIKYGPNGTSTWTFKPLEPAETKRPLARLFGNKIKDTIERDDIIWLKRQQ